MFNVAHIVKLLQHPRGTKVSQRVSVWLHLYTTITECFATRSGSIRVTQRDS